MQYGYPALNGAISIIVFLFYSWPESILAGLDLLISIAFAVNL
jgi:hypothetical protein